MARHAYLAFADPRAPRQVVEDHGAGALVRVTLSEDPCAKRHRETLKGKNAFVGTLLECSAAGNLRVWSPLLRELLLLDANAIAEVLVTASHDRDQHDRLVSALAAWNRAARRRHERLRWSVRISDTTGAISTLREVELSESELRHTLDSSATATEPRRD